jgi:small-conductance mechanosensitive channel
MKKVRLLVFLSVFLGSLYVFLKFPILLSKIPYVDIIVWNISVYALKIFAIIVGFFLYKSLGYEIIYPLILSFLRKVTSDEDDYDTFKKIFSFIWWAVYLVLTLGLIVGFSKLVTSIGLIGLGLSLAFQKPILNIVGWFTIVSKQIYKEGDRVEVYPQRTQKPIRGDIKRITLFHTELEDLYNGSESKSGKISYIPNEYVLFSEIKNYCKESNYILNELYLRITLKSNFQKAKSLFEKAIKKIVIKHSKEYLKKIKQEKKELDLSLKNLLKKKKNVEELGIKKEEIEGKSQILDEEIKKVEELSSELSPKIFIQISEEGYIRIIGQYLIPYTLVKKSTDEIYELFLEIIRDDNDIELWESKSFEK